MLTIKKDLGLFGRKELQNSERTEQHIVKLPKIQNKQFFICWGAACSNTCGVAYVRLLNSPTPNSFGVLFKFKNKRMKNLSYLNKGNLRSTSCIYSEIQDKVEEAIFALQWLIREIEAKKPATTKQAIINKLNFLESDLEEFGFSSPFYTSLISSAVSSIKDLKMEVANQ